VIPLFTLPLAKNGSVLPKFDQLHVNVAVDVYRPHIICIVETWLCNDTFDNELFISGYQLFRFDRNRHGGGILMYVNDTFTVQFKPSPSSPLELMSLSISNSSHVPIHFCLFYRPPSTGNYIFDLLCSYLQSIDAIHFCNFVCLGDFNINFDNESHPLFSDLSTFSS
jgi:hypothetical protein